ncbi:SusC/RagA family TonB-linked outer membrane protein [Pedobacter nutrimenti]|uniref:SusC/RagA family TonB-linked outer membrane protein n=1 Tax=Pedobacter nutrimenti TaxID=1241337 RepID=UPI00292E3D4B|nr:SusC/RagA family TonB-linked outer membrane protein [Pedobacter nutrimenti]
MKKTIQTIVLAALCLNFPASAQQKNPPPSSKQSLVKGKVISLKTREPLEGAAIQNINTALTLFTDKHGEFPLDLPAGRYRLAVFLENYQTEYLEIRMPLKEPLVIELEPKDNNLNEVQIIGYGETTKRLNTGSISTMTAKQIENQPVTNVLSALSGQMPGVYVQTTNGLPGGNINIQIRGKGSIAAGTNPLYIIDGVPFPGSSLVSNSPLGGEGIVGEISPLNSINPSDIESINVLKDADATAIYGSRGANGVVLITTKKAKVGSVQTDVNIAQGFSQVASMPKLLGLDDYLNIRREAFKNDGLIPSSDPTSYSYAPDLTLWDNKTSTNWAKYVMGHTARTTAINATVSGGTMENRFSIGANYRNETSVMMGDNDYKRGGTRLSLEHHSADERFSIQSSLSYTKEENKGVNPREAFSSFVLLPPNFPLRDPNGNLNWALGYNPLAAIQNTSQTKVENILSNTTIGYEILQGLHIKANIGLNTLGMTQVMVNPKSARNPNAAPVSYTYFGNTANRSIIVEPQLDYTLKIRKSAIGILVGGTWQNSTKENHLITATNFNSESMLEDMSSAGQLNANYTDLVYKYVSVFSRITYNADDKYLLNLSARRDGSSRFGANNQFGNFGAIGAAWVFSNEKWAAEYLSFINYAKLRASYGITGNDQITDDQFLSTYRSSGLIYQGNAGLMPARIANEDFKWESNKKLEVGLEASLFKERLRFTINHFENISGNQLVNYTLPLMTGFDSYQANLPAKVKNSGWEVELNTNNIRKERFVWTTNFNITLLKNRLLSFPDLATSSYSNFLTVGESTLRATGFKYLGADPLSGAPLYALKNGGSSSYPDFENYYTTIGDKSPAYYGGLGNSFSYKGFGLDVFAQFAKQFLFGSLTSPGTLTNNFALAAGRWQKEGEVTDIPKASTFRDFYYGLSSANFFKASYLRLKNIQLSYRLPDSWLKRNKLNRLRINLQVQNLLTFWNRNAALYDPESGADANIPPLKSFVLGIQLGL